MPPKAKQIATLMLSTGLSTVAGLLVSIFNTHNLSPEQFSDFRLLIAGLTFISVVITGGVFYSLGQLSAQSEDGVVSSTGIPILLVLSCLTTVVVVVLSQFSQLVFSRDISHLLLITSPLAGAYLLSGLLENLLQGKNRVAALSLWRSLPPIVYLLLGIAWIRSFGAYDETVASLLQLGALMSIGLLLLKREGLGFRARGVSTAAIRKLWTHNKSYGFPLYIGALGSVAAVQLGAIILAHFTSRAGVGYFVLAQTIAVPLTIVGSAMGTVHYRSFATMNAMPMRVIGTAVLLCCGAFMAYQLLIGVVFGVFFPTAYSPALKLARIAAIGYTAHGLGDMVNRFLCANGEVLAVRNSTLAVGAVSVLGYLLLTQHLHEIGASFAVVLTSATYLALMVGRYIALQRRNRMLNIVALTSEP